MRFQRFIIGPAAHGSDSNILLVTLGLSIVIENVLLYFFRADTRTIDAPYGFSVVSFAGLTASPLTTVRVFGVRADTAAAASRAEPLVVPGAADATGVPSGQPKSGFCARIPSTQS